MVSVIVTLTDEEKARRDELLSRPEYADLYPWRAASKKPNAEESEGNVTEEDLKSDGIPDSPHQ